MGGWTVVGAPIDCAGRSEGEERAPAAFRAARIADRVGAEDAGDACQPITDPSRDPASGVIGYGQIRIASASIAKEVADVLAAGRRPLVLGGDCTLLPGALAGARQRCERLALAFVDGHLDCYDGHTSPTGECADMDLAIVTGGAPGLTEGFGPGLPIVEPADVAVLGYRDDSGAGEPGVGAEVELVDDRIERHTALQLRHGDPGRIASSVAQRLADAGAVWLHFDVDALDEAALPAVSYPQPDGLSWQEAETVVKTLSGLPELVGVSVADLNSDRDPDGAYAERITAMLERTLV